MNPRRLRDVLTPPPAMDCPDFPADLMAVHNERAGRDIADPRLSDRDFALWANRPWRSAQNDLPDSDILIRP